MGILWPALYVLASLLGFVIFIVVLVKLFKTEGVLKGILGIISCGIYPFIWGWVKNRELKLTKVMVVWTVTIVASFVIPLTLLSGGLLSLVGSLQSAGDAIRTPTRRSQGISQKPVPQAVSKPVLPPSKPGTVGQSDQQKLTGEDLEIKALNDFITKNSTNADAFYNRALLYEQKGNLTMAEKDYSKAIELNSEHAEAYYNRGLIFAKTKKYELAVRDFDAFLSLNPRSFEAYCNRGNVNYKLGKKNLALKDYTSALKIKPNDADLYYNRAVVYQAEGQISKAQSDFKKAAALGHAKAKSYLLDQGKKSAGAASVIERPSVLWKSDLRNVEIPSTVVSGMIHGEKFVSKSAELANGILTIRDGADFFPNHAVMVFLFLKEGESPEGKSYDISQTSDFGSPHIHMKWKPENSKVPKTKVFMKDYAMRLNFGSVENGKLPGKIYLCLPDEMKSVAAGSFNALIKETSG